MTPHGSDAPLSDAPLSDAPPNPFSLRLFGPFAASVHNIPLTQKRSRKEAWLLSLLVLRSSAPVERSWVAGTLWPEASEEAALYNLRRNLVLLRNALGPEAGRLLSPAPRTLRLDLAGANCDLTAFDAALRRNNSVSRREAAVLYTGPLLLGCLEEWALPEREAREQAVLQVLETLAAESRERRDLAEAAAFLHRALAIDPLRETALRALLETLAAQGSQAAALDAYRAFRARLRDEMNVEPDPQTVALSRSLRTESRQTAVSHPAASPASVKNLDAVRSHLPAPLTTLVGREKQIETVAAHLSRARLVTLTGSGGIGKTRLALAAAERVQHEHPDGAWFADLSPLAEPKQMVQTVLDALDAREAPGRSPSDALTEFLRPRRLLLVLDNCEHLISACAYLAEALLAQCPGLHLLTTSREILGVPGEVTCRVPSLSLPDNASEDPEESEAVRLFTERTQMVRPGWRPAAEDYAKIAEICRRLDGIPLAIEMAAARARSLPIHGIASRLGEGFRLLSGPGGGVVPRHQTLRATLDWSWDLLEAEEQLLLSRLSVFVGGWTLEAAEEVCGRGLERTDTWQVLDILTGLIDKSLAVYEERDGAGRYRLLETVRQYAFEKLQEQDAAAVSRAHLDYFLGYAEAARRHQAGPAEAQWLERLEAEQDNLRAALAWARSGGPEMTELRLACALSRFWQVRGNLSEGRAFLSAARLSAEVVVMEAEPPAKAKSAALRGEALRAEASFAMTQGCLADAEDLFQQALAGARRTEEERAEAAALGGLGMVQSSKGEYQAARGLLLQALALNRNLGNWEEQAANLGGLGYLAREAGDYPAAEAYLTEAVTLSREQGDTLAEGSNLGSLAYVVLHRGDLGSARRLLERTLALYRQLGNRLGESWTLSSLGFMAAEAGQVEEAVLLVQQALGINRAVGHQAGEAWNLNALGELQIRQGDYGLARTTLQQALQISRMIGIGASEADILERLGDAARGQKDDVAAAAFYADAAALMQTLNLSHSIDAVQKKIAALRSEIEEANQAACVQEASGAGAVS